MKTLQVGLIGFGMGGRVFHAPLITNVAGFHLNMIRETRPENIRLIQERYPGVAVVADAEEILRNKEIDLVIVATPNRFHFEWAKKALEAGKHVVVEKPFTVSSAEADELIALSGKLNRLLTVYQNRRWDGDFLTVRQVIASGMLGKLVAFESHFDRFRNNIRPDTWKESEDAGTGLVYDLGSHLIDQVQVLFGLPEAVTAHLETQRNDTAIVDSFEILLHFPELTVTLKSGMLVREPLPKYILSGQEGSFVKYGMDVQEAALDDGQKPGSKTWGMEPEANWGTINTSTSGLNLRGKVETLPGNYLRFYENVCSVILGEAALIVKPEQARNTIRIIELAMQSNQEKKTIPFSV